jgi:hypothetical protein
MRKLLFAVTTALLFFASCTEGGDEPTPQNVKGDFIASFADPNATFDGKAAAWSEDDCLTIFSKNAQNFKYQVKALSDGGATATFGYVSATGSSSAAIASNYALYPYDADATISGNTITTKLAAKQTYSSTKGCRDYALMVAKSKDKNLAMTNVGAFLEFEISKTIADACTLRGIKISSAANKLAGSVTIDCGSEGYTATVASNGSKEIVLSGVNAKITSEAQSFYVAIPAGNFPKNSVTVTYVFAEGEKAVKLPAFSLAPGAVKTVTHQINNEMDYGKRSLSILFVGNSLTQDGIAYLPYMLKNYYPGVDFKIYMWYMGGFTMEQQYSNFTSSGVADIFSVAENNESWTNYSKSMTMKSVLEKYKFDIVCMQEYFNYKTSYTDCKDWNNCRNFILEHYKGGNDPEFISLLHAPLRKAGAADDVHTVYNRTKDGNAKILKETVSDDLIPFGIAVYNALSTDLNNLGDLKQLSPDGTHTQEGLPCLLQTYVALEWVFDRFDMDETVKGNPMRMTKAIYDRIKVPGANLGSGVVTGTDAQYTLAQDVAIKAYAEGKKFLQDNL